MAWPTFEPGRDCPQMADVVRHVVRYAREAGQKARARLNWCVLPAPIRNLRGLSMKRLFVALAALAGLGGCADTADTFPLNAAAKQIGVLKINFERTGVARGPITITMPDGEILKGEYRVAFGGGAGMAFSGANSATALVITDGPVQFVASGPKTQILCRGTSSAMGHGNGQCQTYEGAVWAVSW